MSLSSGTTLGPYEIIAPLGAGGMGEVYRARDTRLDRGVAIKVLPSQFNQNPELRARFEREAKTISGLQHPNICVLHDVGRQDGVDFLVMEYLEGETLSARLKKGALPLNEALKLSIEVASALGAAHRKGIVHRDLKPGNIMLTATGAKLLDFGLAKYEGRAAADDKTMTKVLTGSAQIVGTLPYMSPEQLHGKVADARSDIFAFGAVLYEMLTGQRAFQRQSDAATIAAVDREEPKPLHECLKGAPHDLERIIRRCLRKQPTERYAAVPEIERELENCRALSEPVSAVNLRVLFRQSKRPRVAIPVLLGLLMLVSLFAWWIHHSSRVRWAKDEAVPQIEQLIEHDQLGEAYALAVQAERYIPRDPMLVKFWSDISWTDSIHTIPSGASVYRRNYNAPDAKWELVGRTPIEKRRFPRVDSIWKFELKGFATVERATFPDFWQSPTVTMDQLDKAVAGMVPVELTSSRSDTVPVSLNGLPGFETAPAVQLGNYWIDRFEVTNAEFKRFVDQGGYQKQEYWKQEFRKDGRLLSWEEAMKFFQDSTGRPGPVGWIQGEYPRGQDNYPVTGVSWFEAAAYAEFAGKELPTIYHWKTAALPEFAASMIPASNFDGRGPAAVGAYPGMSWTGALDMAGNVKEWVLNQAGSDQRYILGGAWSEPTYMFNEADARSPFQRSSTFGFRCAKYVLTGEEAKAAESVTAHRRDYDSEKPVSDQVFQAYKSLYSYDKTSLHPVVESLAETEYWKEEKITFDAAYGGEKVIAYLFLPRKTSPPFQAVVHFPGIGAIYERSSANLADYLGAFDFIVKSGRAVIFPEYKGTFDRWDNFKRFPKDTSNWRDHVIYWSKDLGRSIDYLETRPDIDHNKFAYEGFSWGAAMGALLPAVEDRLQALILLSPGLFLAKQLPEVDQLNFAPRVKAPVLMLNGRFDFIYPAPYSQEPLFRLLGTPQQHKRRVVYDTGHDLPTNEVIKETLNWLDRYLGPVN
ncbi:MAG TPA: protein kinase [Terriglobales bacterium]|nr:protein kinase [Terriglobales bacterium]